MSCCMTYPGLKKESSHYLYMPSVPNKSYIAALARSEPCLVADKSVLFIHMTLVVSMVLFVMSPN